MKIKLIICLCLILLSNATAYAHSDKEKKAAKAIMHADFKQAAAIYEEIIAANPNNAPAKRLLADIYLTLNERENAEKWLGQLAAGPNAAAAYKFSYAQVLMANGKTEEAKKMYLEFAEIAPNDSRAKFFKHNPDYLEKLLKVSSPYILTNIGAINTEHSEMCAVSYGNSIVFSSNKQSGKGNKYYDLYSSLKSNETNYESPQKMKSQINSSMHDGPVVFTKEQNYVYVTRSETKGSGCACGKDKINHFKIYEGYIGDGNNDKFKQISFANEGYSIGHATLSADDNTMIFSSNMLGGFGESDLYITSKVDGRWSTPINLGKEVNSPGREVFPFLSADGDLYFSTDGRIGLGGLDVYKAVKKDNRYANIYNMGMPINSVDDDFGIYFNDDESAGYLSSNRKEGKGGDDIYAIGKAAKMNMEVTLVDALSKEELTGGQVELFDLERKTLTIKTSGDFGSVKFELDEYTPYKIKSKKEGYKAKEISFKTLGRNVEKQTVRVPLRKDGGIVLIITVQDNEGNNLPAAAVTVEEEITKMKKTVKTNDQGKATVTLSPDRNYKILATKRVPDMTISYSVSTEKISTEGIVEPFTMYVNLKIEKFVEGTVTEIPSVYYDVNSSGIRYDAVMPLEKLITILKKNPKMMIEIRSHTDSRGDDNVNLSLSSSRASAMAQYIIDKGISANRITSKGYGETELKNRCSNGVNCSEKEHQENRRTEFKILKVK